MNTSAIANLLDNLNAEVAVIRSKGSYIEPHERWTCTIELTHSSTQLKTRDYGATLDDALLAAYSKISPLISHPTVAAALDLPLLSAPQIDLESLHPGAAE